MRFPGLLILAVTACVPADPPEGRRTHASHGTPNGPRLGSSRALPSTSQDLPSSKKSSTAAVPSVRAEATSDRLLTMRFTDDFSRTTLGANYRATSNAWRLDAGRLCVRGAHNHPLWLTVRLPTNARIELDAESSSSDGDIKVEAWGDGRSAATTSSYSNASSYIFILGGWKNTRDVLARLDEHATTRRELALDAEGNDPRTAPVEPGRTYHLVIERRDGHTVRFIVNDVEILSMDDPHPLRGPGHEYFAFNDWETDVCFDNLDILPLEG